MDDYVRIMSCNNTFSFLRETLISILAKFLSYLSFFFLVNYLFCKLFNASFKRRKYLITLIKNYIYTISIIQLPYSFIEFYIFVENKYTFYFYRWWSTIKHIFKLIIIFINFYRSKYIQYLTFNISDSSSRIWKSLTIKKGKMNDF